MRVRCTPPRCVSWCGWHSPLVRAHWTEQIHDEWVRNLLANHPGLSAANVHRTRELMDRHVGDALVTGYEHRIPSLVLPDADDRHVLAAAIHSEASLIVTFNLSDFPARQLSPYGIGAVHPDEFVLRLLDAEPQAVCGAVKSQRLALRNPPKTVDDFLPVLEQCGLTRAVAVLRSMADSL